MITALKLALLASILIEVLSLNRVTFFKREREVVTGRERARLAGPQINTFKIFAGVWVRFMRSSFFASVNPKIDVLTSVIEHLWPDPTGEEHTPSGHKNHQIARTVTASTILGRNCNALALLLKS